MSVKAQSRYLKISAQKLRQAADLARQQRAVDALDVLRFTNKKSALMVYDTIKSAMANAENNNNLNANNLVISEIRVDQGPRLRRYRPRSRGMANTIIHPMAHLTVVLDESKPTDKPAASATTAQSKTRQTTASPANAHKEKK